MKIAHISIYPKKEGTHSHFGGVAGYTKNLITNTSYDTEDCVYVLCNILDEKVHYEEDGVKVVRCFDKKIFTFFQIYNQIRSIKPDIIHIQHEVNLYGGILNAYLFIFFIMFLKRKKVVITLHNIVSRPTVDRKFMRMNYSHIPAWIARIGFIFIFSPMKYFADTFIVHTQQHKKILIDQYGFNADCISVIAHGVEDLEAIDKNTARQNLNIRNDQRVVLYMGYATGYKGLDLLIEGFSEYAKIDPKAHLILAAGKHPKLKNKQVYIDDYERLIDKAKRMIPIDQYTWKGFVEEEEIPDYFSAADAVIFPYVSLLSSSGPMSIAIGYNKPILMSELFRGVVELKDENAFFELDPKSLGHTLELFFNNKLNIESDILNMRNAKLWKIISAKTYELYNK